MNDRFNIRYFNKKSKKFEYLKIGAVNFNLFTDWTVYEQGQFCTGLKDKNGKLIYEGDIVKVKVEYENVWGCDEYGGKIITHIYMGKIIFEECAFKIDVIDTTRHPLSLSYHNNDLEVIGNIYENKELLDERN